MTFAGYAGMLATLAFVLGLVLLVARLAKRFLPGTVQASGGNSFTVVQRIALGQRQGIAIVQRGDLLIGVSVGEGGVRTLFTLPQDDTMKVAVPDDAQRHDDDRDDTRRRDVLPIDIGIGANFRTALQSAMRGPVARALMIALGLLAAAGVSTVQAQVAPPVRPAPVTAPPVITAPPLISVPPRQGTAAAAAPAGPRTPGLNPIANTPAAANAAALLAAQQGGLRTLPPAASQPGPRDLPRRADPQAPAPRPAKPAVTASKSGGEATIAPLLPAPQARDIAALRERAAGTGPLTTAEAQRIAGRADSMISKLAPQMELKVGGGAGQGDGLRLSGTVGVVVMMGLLSMLPVLLLMMTGFTRILVVLHFLKQALGTQSAPPGQLLAAMALLLSGFVMAPTLKEVNTTALEPWMEGRIEQVEMMSRAMVPFKAFMLRQVRDQDLQTFVDLAEIKQPESREAVPLTILMSAFVTSELRTAFQIGFALFLPFIVIDVVVGSVLMSMGMVMLPPAMISMPFKLLLFVLVDGWGLVVTGLVQSFR